MAYAHTKFQGNQYKTVHSLPERLIKYIEGRKITKLKKIRSA